MVVGSQLGLNWVFVSAGVRTRILQGPLIHGAPVQWVVFARAAVRLPDAPITARIEGYSAAAPWSNTFTTPATARMRLPGLIDPSHVDIGMPPWDAGIPMWFTASPWVEFYVTTNLNCMAHVYII